MTRTDPSPYYEAIKATRRRLILSAMKRHGTMRRAAVALGVSVATVCRECKVLGIRVQTHRTVEVA